MSECWGGDTCSYPGDGWDEWDWEYYFGGGGGGGNGGDPGDGGGGGGSNGDTGDSEPAIDTHTAQDIVAAATRLKAVLNSDLIKQGLTAAQKTKIGRMAEAIDELIDRINTGTQVSDHYFEQNWSELVAEVVGFLAAAGLVTIVGSITTVGTVVTLTGIVAGLTAEELTNRLLDAAPGYFNDWAGSMPSDDDWWDMVCQGVPNCNYEIPPVVLDLDGDGVELLKKSESKARIDIDGDGFAEKFSWVSPDDGILVIDHNKNGKVDSMNEFAFASFAGPGASDLEGLRLFDDNNDGFFDSKDSAYDDAYIWQDLNSNASQQRSELFTLSELNIVSISLTGEENIRLDSDSMILNDMVFTRLNEDKAVVGKAVDVFFEADADSGIRVDKENDVRIITHENGKITLNLKKQISSDIDIGRDSFMGQTNFDVVKSGSGDDHINVTSDNPIEVVSGKGNDTISVETADSKIAGREGNDIIQTGSGDDELHGNRGNDLLNGGGGKNLLVGGKGKDFFVVGNGKDVIMDYEKGKDTIGIHGIDETELDLIISNPYSTPKGTMFNVSETSSFMLYGIDSQDIQDVSFEILE